MHWAARFVAGRWRQADLDEVHMRIVGRIGPIIGGNKELQMRTLVLSTPLMLLLGCPVTGQDRDAQWRAQIRSALFVPGPLPPLDATTHGKFEPEEGVVAERVTYQTQFGLRVPAILYLPKKHNGRLPALIVVN